MLTAKIVGISLGQVHRSTSTQGHIQKFPDWLPGVRTANGTALCH